MYNADAMEGLPVGIQLIGRKWEDEKVIEMMKVVDGALVSGDLAPMVGRSGRLPVRTLD